ncbi:uncharacterized protein LOC134226313 [Armigeres subalbatus]|uniref:uncharacterized protein LOC134226313 n=1 Tax=Armigeres subalbatus TaxID=124917 RepID=UPI002ED30EF8
MQQKNDAKLYQRCCRICMDDTREQIDVVSDETLVETLNQLYNVKVDINDRISSKVCLECIQEAKETQKWLSFYEEQKKLIAENQRVYNEELVNQLGPEATHSPARSPSISTKTLTRTPRTRNPPRRIDDDDEEEVKGEKDEDFIPSKSARKIKKEPISTRRSIKREWVPSSDGSGRGSTTTTPTDNGSDDEDESETGTSTSDGELKCPKCEKVFSEIDQLERHNCEFICNICSAAVKYRNSLKRHLMVVHKIKANQWEDYWNPTGDQGGASLLVETKKPKKRYRYESDSPTDMEDDSNNDEDQKDLICSSCGDKFYSTQEMKNHDCDYGCNICGASFASRNSVKRHKIRLHNVDPNDPSVASHSRAPSATTVVSTPKPASRPPSRAASENASDDEPLSAMASDETRYRYFCPDCDYSSYRRYTVTTHLAVFHKTPKEQIDVEAIVKKIVPRTSDIVRSKTPVPAAVSDETPVRSKTPIPVEPAVVRAKTPDPTKAHRPPSTIPAIANPQAASSNEYQQVDISGQHRSRSRSIHRDSRNSSKRKRSLSSCSNKAPRAVRARSNPPVDRQILTAKRRLSPSRILASVHEKFRPTVTAIQSNRLFVSIRQGCELIQQGQQIRFRASSYLLQDSCPTKRLFRLRAPVGNERQQVQNLRGIFNKLSHQISAHSKVNEIDVDSLVLDYIHNPTAAQSSSPVIKDNEGTTYEIRELDNEETTEVIDVEPSASVQVEDDGHNAEPPTETVTKDDGQVAENDAASSHKEQDKENEELTNENEENPENKNTEEPMEVDDVIQEDDNANQGDENVNLEKNNGNPETTESTGTSPEDNKSEQTDNEQSQEQTESSVASPKGNESEQTDNEQSQDRTEPAEASPKGNEPENQNTKCHQEAVDPIAVSPAVNEPQSSETEQSQEATEPSAASPDESQPESPETEHSGQDEGVSIIPD